jgi:RimJ/RimL family protein N-acetyltransferase
MASPSFTALSEPFIILTPRLVVIPTPIAIHITSYRALYAELYADAGFCRMGFGASFPAQNWNDDETRDTIQTRDINRSWEKHGLGDFAVGLRPQPNSGVSGADPQQEPFPRVSILRGDEFEQFMGPDLTHLEEIQWVGYSGVRDATTTSLPPLEAGDAPYPDWLEMVEIRYGVSPAFWGKSIAQEATEAIMRWAIREKGVKRFIAETERDNQRSGRLLQKLGFVHSGTNYWKERQEMEWELLVAKE